MSFNKGDKVKFLDEKCEGIIVSVSAGYAQVITSDGFEVSYPLSKLVHSRMGHERAPDVLQKKEVPEGIYLLFIPEDEAKLFECALGVYLVNHTGYDIYFSFSYKYHSEFISMQSGGVGQGAVVELDTIQRAELDQYSTIKVDLIFFRKLPYKPIEPVSKVVKLKTIKFYKESAYAFSPLVERKAHAETITSFHEQPIQVEKVNVAELAKFLKEKKDKGPKFSKPHTLLEREVDLHLEEILDDERSMNNSEKLEYQLNYFRSELEDAISSNVRRIVFIHGIGNGRLKSEIRNILDTYANVSYYDASYRLYGFGATEVVINRS